MDGDSQIRPKHRFTHCTASKSEPIEIGGVILDPDTGSRSILPMSSISSFLITCSKSARTAFSSGNIPSFSEVVVSAKRTNCWFSGKNRLKYGNFSSKAGEFSEKKIVQKFLQD